MKFSAGVVKKVAGLGELRESRLRGSHNLNVGVNELLSPFATLLYRYGRNSA